MNLLRAALGFGRALVGLGRALAGAGGTEMSVWFLQLSCAGLCSLLGIWYLTKLGYVT